MAKHHKKKGAGWKILLVVLVLLAAAAAVGALLAVREIRGSGTDGKRPSRWRSPRAAASAPLPPGSGRAVSSASPAVPLVCRS